MRALIVATLVLAGATAAYHARAGEPPAAIPLWRAARDGKVSVHGGSTGSYSQAQVTIQNRTDGELSVDVNGSYLMPLGDYQRLGLGLLQKGSSVTEVTLPRGASATVTVLSVCMDVHKHSPDTSTRFSLASVAAPTPIHRALEQWKKSPELDQSSVQCAVWNTEPAQVRAGQKNAKGQIISGLPEATHKVAVCDGVVYALVGPGELMAAAPGAEFQPVAQDVEDVVACEGAVHALFRVAPAAVTSGTRERRYCVSRLENRTWTEEVTVAKLGRLEWATSGIAILALGAELDLLTGKPGGRAAVSRSIGKATDQLVPVKGGA
ncbi:MAG TPA: hypothetical protein VFF73_33165, partial [Planctomycetota bacterium]|nr:hypothetical protein [Planctomycetota bacterium]